MIRRLILLVLAVLPAQTVAETVKVRSGEHAGFSRLVLQLEVVRDWRFGRVPGGYELRLDGPRLELDLTRVFDLIPRTRIRDLKAIDPRRMKLEVTCDCSADVFELRPGRIVVDIKDGPARTGSVFEKDLPQVAAAANAGPTSDAEGDPKLLDNVTIADPPGHDPINNDPDFESEISLQPSGLIRSGAAEENASVPRSVLPVVFVPGSRQDERGLDRAQGAGEASDTSKATKQATDTPVDIASEPAPVADLFPPSRSGRDIVAETKQSLLQQLGLAAAQGLIKVDTIPDLPPDPSTGQPGPNPPEKAPITPPADQDRRDKEHVQISTAVERDSGYYRDANARNESDAGCLDPSLFDVAAWGPSTPGSSPFESLRPRLVGEFDRPDPVAVQALARRYIYLGFGAEVQGLFDSLDVKFPNMETLIELARIVDDETTISSSTLAAQQSCRSDAAMWAVLAAGRAPVSSEIDLASVIRTFSGLPPHLRGLLGPRLAEIFLNSRDMETATEIRDLIDRAPGDRDARFSILQALLANADGETDEALEKLTKVAMSGGPQEAQAVVALIESKIRKGKKVSDKTALLADALAVEYRGTELGRKLTLAAIRGLAVSGKARATFERIRAAESGGDLTSDELRELRYEAHLRNAENSSDAEFLEVLFANELVVLPDDASALRARTIVSDRLVELGLPQMAIRLFDPVSPRNETEKRVLSKAFVAARRPAEALQTLTGADSEDGQALRAAALELLGQFDQAQEIYDSLGKDAESASASLRSGDWSALVKLSANGAEPAASPKGPVALAKSLIEISKAKRGDLSGILAAN